MINQKIVASYKDFYDHPFKGNLVELFFGLSKEMAFGMIDLLNRSAGTYETTSALIRFLQNWFSRGNQPAFSRYAKRLQQMARRDVFQQNEIIIFNSHSNLAYIECLLRYLQTNTDEVIERPSNEQMEINLLDSYLIINEQLDRSNNGLPEISRTYPTETLFWLSMNKAFQYSDLLDINSQELFITEVGKSIMLFEHIRDNIITLPVLERFLEKYECVDWLDYLKAIAGMSAASFDTANFKGNTFIEIDLHLPFYNTCIKILDQISVQIDLAEFSEDFLYLRNRPIYRQGENKFQILSKKFFIEKIFRALYFELRAINLELGLMSDTKFRTVTYTSGYSENTLFYNVLDKIFFHAKSVKHGKEMEGIDAGFGVSDYLAEQNENLFIFESKDILIKKEVKERLFIPEMREEFRKKFYKDGHSDKAVLQLARNVKKLLDGEYSKFGFLPVKYRFIYPIIVVHSESFNIIGINQILFTWFKEACLEVGISKKESYKIKRVVLIDINTLLYFQDIINKNKVGLNQIIDIYISKTRIPIRNIRRKHSVESFQSQYLIPFSFFLNVSIKKIKRVRVPSNLISKIRRIFPKF